MSQTLFRVKKESSKFAVIDKHYVLEDDQLSWKAKGILTYLLCRPDDWKIYLNELLNHADDGKDATNSGIDELIEYGYMNRNRIRKDDGTFGGYEYIVYERPHNRKLTKAENPNTEKPKTDNPNTDNPPLLNNESTNNKRTNNKNTNKQEDKLDTYQQYSFNEVRNYIDNTTIDLTDKQIKKLLRINSNEKIIIKAIQQTVNKDKPSSYIKSCLRDWKDNNLNSEDQVRRYIINHYKEKEYKENDNLVSMKNYS